MKTAIVLWVMVWTFILTADMQMMGDSRFYLHSAQTFQETGQFLNPPGTPRAGKPMNIFPIGYPLMISLGMDAMTTARAINILASGVIAFALLSLLETCKGSVQAGALLAFFLAPGVMNVQMSVMSDFVFLAFIALHLLAVKRGWIVGAAVLMGMIPMLRYAGVGLLLISMGVLILWGANMRQIGLYALISCTPIALVILANTLQWGEPMGGRSSSDFSVIEVMSHALVSVFTWQVWVIGILANLTFIWVGLSRVYDRQRLINGHKPLEQT